MYWNHNEGKSRVAERFVKTLRVKNYKKMMANDIKYYFGYLNKLANEYNNTYHHSVRKPVDADYSDFTEEIELIHKAYKFKVGDRVRITKCKNISS